MSYTPGRQATHCAYCGARFQTTSWPRDCPSCQETTWANPIPVSVTLLPVTDTGGSTKLVVVRRSISPGFGRWALPGGYIELGETWQQAAVRELWEESRIVADAADVRLFDVDQAVTTVQIFALLPARPLGELPRSEATEEAFGWDLLDGPTELAFPTHTTAVGEFFRREQPPPGLR
ncbi:MAG: NUDIX domain-containing protein [Stackebrandtia sp.]